MPGLWSFQRTGSDSFDGECQRLRLENLVLLDYQPYESLPDILASADVLVAVLEPDAGRFFVPSKVPLIVRRSTCSWCDARRARSGESLQTSGAGVVVAPDHHDEAIARLSICSLRRNCGLRWERLGDATPKRRLMWRQLPCGSKKCYVRRSTPTRIISLLPAIAESKGEGRECRCRRRRRCRRRGFHWRPPGPRTLATGNARSIGRRQTPLRAASGHVGRREGLR